MRNSFCHLYSACFVLLSSSRYRKAANLEKVNFMKGERNNLREWGILEEWRSYQEDKGRYLKQVKKLYSYWSFRTEKRKTEKLDWVA